LEEELLIKELKSGSEAAFEELVGLYETMAFNACLAFVKNPEDAEDLSQEVFLEVYKSIGSFRGESKLSTWIYRIAATKSLDFLRKQKAQKRFAVFTSFFGFDTDKDKSPGLSYDHPGVNLDNKERSIVVFKAIDTLPENQKAAFTLSKIENLSHEEIAVILNTTVSAVQSLVHRAKQNLHKYLYNYYKNEFKS
jgi:RNA polymerase sigma-70 factor (ECF subfamily)